MATYTSLTAEELKEIVAPYGIAVDEFDPVDGGNANSNYHLRSKKKNYILTIIEERTAAETQNLIALLQWLETHNFLPSRILPAVDGRLLTSYDRKPVVIKKWIRGEVPEKLSSDMLRQIGRKMAGLHQIPMPDSLPRFHAYGLPFFSTLTRQNIDPEYEGWLEKQIQLIKTNLPPDLPKGLIHGDLFFDNVLFEDGRIQAIIDYEEACHAELIFDLGMGVTGLCQGDQTIDLSKAQALVAGYEQVRPLEIVEKKSLQLFIGYAATATSCWRFWKYNIHTPTPRLRNKHQEMVKLARQAIDWKKDEFMSIVFNDLS